MDQFNEPSGDNSGADGGEILGIDLQPCNQGETSTHIHSAFTNVMCQQILSCKEKQVQIVSGVGNTHLGYNAYLAEWIGKKIVMELVIYRFGGGWVASWIIRALLPYFSLHSNWHEQLMKGYNKMAKL